MAIAVPSVGPPLRHSSLSLNPSEGSGHSCCARIQKCMGRTQEAFNNSWAGRFYNRYYRYRPLAVQVANFATHVFSIRAINGMLNIYALSTVVTGDAWRNFSGWQRMIRYGKILSALAIPIALYGIWNEIKELIHGTHDKIGSVLRITEWTSWMGYAAGTCLSTIHSMGVAIANVAHWAFGFYVASGFLAIATIIIHARNLYQSNRINKRISSEPEEVILKELNGKSSKELEARFEVDGVVMKEFVEAVVQRVQDGAEGALLLRTRAISAIGVRIRSKILVDKMALIASIIVTIATMLLLFTPFFPAAYACYACSSALSIVKFFYDKRSSTIFHSRMDELLAL